MKNIRLTGGLLSVLTSTDFSCKMDNKIIIAFGSRKISELFRPRTGSSASKRWPRSE